MADNPGTSSASMSTSPASLPKRATPDADRRNAQSHEAVLRAAERLLQAKGYTSISVDQIAAEAGVGKATIYRWWSSKASVFMELYTVLADSMMHPVDTGSLEGDLRWLVRGAFKLFRESVAGIALAGFVAEGQSNPEVARILRQEFALQRRKRNMLILQRAIGRGEVSPETPLEAVSDVITGAVYYAILIGDYPITDERADQIVQTVVAGIRSSSAAAGAPRTAQPQGKRKPPARSAQASRR
jgi:AcrR family transcriptional regulator